MRRTPVVAPKRLELSLPNHMPSQLPCNSQGQPVLGLDGCTLPLPATPEGAPGVAHFYRAPWDVVTSAYWYHSQQPVPQYEAWLNTTVRCS